MEFIPQFAPQMFLKTLSEFLAIVTLYQYLIIMVLKYFLANINIGRHINRNTFADLRCTRIFYEAAMLRRKHYDVSSHVALMQKQSHLD